MAAVRTPAIILHSFPYGDTSRILRILTPEHGVRSLLARGARSPKSRFGAVLEPFTEGEAQFNLRPNRDLLTLSGFSLVRSRQSIGRNLLAFSGASLAAELVLRFATDEAQPELYSLVAEGFDRLGTEDADTAASTLAILWSIIAAFGFQPLMDACMSCGRQLRENEPVRLRADLGGVVCSRCGGSGRAVNPVLRSEISALSMDPRSFASLSDPRAHGEILSSFISSHVLHGRPLRSLPIYLDLLR